MSTLLCPAALESQLYSNFTFLVKSASYESHRKKTCDGTFSKGERGHWVHMVTA